jgi:hypothetical protein
VLSEEYAVQIARDWDVPQSGVGFVTRFRIRESFLAPYEVHQVGGRGHRQYWIPASDLPVFNRALVGRIEVIRSFP